MIDISISSSLIDIGMVHESCFFFNSRADSEAKIKVSRGIRDEWNMLRSIKCLCLVYFRFFVLIISAEDAGRVGAGSTLLRISLVSCGTVGTACEGMLEW